MAGSADDQQIGTQFVCHIDYGSHWVTGPQMGLKLHPALFRHPACLLKHAVEAARGNPGLLPDLFDVLRQIRNLPHADQVKSGGALLRDVQRQRHAESEPSLA
jgi:hypothetical protein